MRLPPELHATRPLKPGTGLESFGIIVSEVDGTFQVAYPSRLRRKILIVPLEDFAPVKEIGVPVAAELQADNPITTAKRALALKDQSLSLLDSNTAEFLSLCLHGHKESHHIDKLKVTLGRVWVGAAVVHDVGAAIGARVRAARRRR